MFLCLFFLFTADVVRFLHMFECFPVSYNRSSNSSNAAVVKVTPEELHMLMVKAGSS